MATYVITGIHRDVHGNVDQATLRRVNPATNQAIGPATVADAHEVANHIAIGDDVYALFIVPGGTVLGPRFVREVYGDGQEGIRLAEDIEGRRLEDMVHFGQ